MAGDVLSLADALFTNDMAALEVGQVRYGAICDDDGKMIMDGTVFHVGPEHCFSITSYDSDLDWFRKVASDRDLDVELKDVTDEMPHLQVQGPLVAGGARARSRRAPTSTRCATSGSSPTASPSAACPVWLSRTGYSGELGFELYCKPEDATELWNAVVERRRAARPEADRAVGDRDAADRIRSPVSRHRLLPASDRPVRGPARQRDQAGLGQRLRGPRGARADRAEGTPRLLTTLRIDGDEVPEYGAAVTVDGGEAGIVRSPCTSPTFDEVIAMASIDRGLVNEGQRVDVALDDGTVGATVAPFPLYDTNKTRPRS